MRRDWTGPAQTKSRAEQKGVGERTSARRGAGGWVARRGPAGVQPRCSRAARSQTGWGLLLNWEGQYAGEGVEWEDNEWDLQSPPAAIEVCLSDQLQLSLKPSLDFDLEEGVNNRKKRNSGRERLVNSAKSDSFELRVCEWSSYHSVHVETGNSRHTEEGINKTLLP